jgi:hypothetical protein
VPAVLPDSARAYPTKEFFIEMFTRDISLEDCILDLIDNSIDSLIRARKIDIEKTGLQRKRPPGEKTRSYLDHIFTD